MTICEQETAMQNIHAAGSILDDFSILGELLRYHRDLTDNSKRLCDIEPPRIAVTSGNGACHVITFPRRVK